MAPSEYVRSAGNAMFCQVLPPSVVLLIQVVPCCPHLLQPVVRKATIGLSASNSLAWLPGLCGARVPSERGGPPSVTACQCWPSSAVLNKAYDSPCMLGPP